MNYLKKFGFLALSSMLVAVMSGCSEDVRDVVAGEKTVINAVIADSTPESRSCIDNSTAGNNSFIGIMWTPEDRIGIYGTSDKNIPFANESTKNSKKTTFAGQSTGLIKYAYFPYSEANNGREVENLVGTLPEVQNIYADRRLEADYKVGAAEGGTFGMNVKFHHILSLVRMQIDAVGTDLSGDALKSIEFTAARAGTPVGLSGDFTFNAVTGAIDASGVNNNTAKAVWKDPVSLGARTYAFMSMLPVLKAGDNLTVTLMTTTRKATFKVTLNQDFKADYFYDFPLSLKVYQENAEKYGWTTEILEPEQPGEVTGEFTCATLNVDGLPQTVKATFIPVTVNKDGPGAEGTKLISQAIANTGWDFFAVSEDFDYDTELKSAISSIYDSGTFRKPGDWTKALSGTLDTDGLNFFWKKDGFSAANETWEEYNNKEGDLTKGANTCIKKGFRHYEVTVAEGVVVDVYITHMNTYSGSGNTESNKYVAAVLGQLRQVRDHILKNLKANKRPAIFMGDTNMRYTRHDIKTNLLDVLAAEEGIAFNDPWVDFHRAGKFPKWNTRSLMILSKFKGDKENDIVCSDDQRGEVVDKIWYFNTAESDVTIEALDLYNDVSDNFVKGTENASYSGVTAEDENGNILNNQNVDFVRKNGLADHFPVVCKFKFTKKNAK